MVAGVISPGNGLPAADYYVEQNKPGASDSNPGTEALPWLTITRAAQTVAAGDTVHVKTGRYTDPDSDSDKAFSPARSGTNDQPVIFRSEPPLAAVVISKDHTSPAFKIYNVDYVTVDGFKIEGQLGTSHANHATLKNCEVIYGAWGVNDTSLNFGIVVHAGNYNLVQNNYVHDMTDSGNHGHNTANIMVIASASGGAEYNVIEKNTADGGGGTVYSSFGQKGGNINHNVWRNNMAMNSTAGFLGMGSTDGLAYSDTNTCCNNVIYNCTFALQFDHNVRYWQVYNNSANQCENFLAANDTTSSYNNLWNNISYGNNTGVALRNGGYPNPLPVSSLFDYADYNDFYNHTNWYYREKVPTLSYSLSQFQSIEGFDLHSITVNPLFVSSGGINPMDYKLQAGSTALVSGRGGSYSTVMGAYITGDEAIGYAAPTQDDTTPPAEPDELIVK